MQAEPETAAVVKWLIVDPSTGVAYNDAECPSLQTCIEQVGRCVFCVVVGVFDAVRAGLRDRKPDALGDLVPDLEVFAEPGDRGTRERYLLDRCAQVKAKPRHALHVSRSLLQRSARSRSMTLLTWASTCPAQGIDPDGDSRGRHGASFLRLSWRIRSKWSNAKGPTAVVASNVKSCPGGLAAWNRVGAKPAPPRRVRRQDALKTETRTRALHPTLVPVRVFSRD
jgi:hypothetical protein